MKPEITDDITLRPRLTVRTAHNPEYRQSWALLDAQALGAQFSARPGGKARQSWVMKINLPELTGEARFFTRATFWQFVFEKFDGPAAAIFYCNTRRFVNYTSSTSALDLYYALSGDDMTRMMSMSYWWPTMLYVPSLVWVPWDIGGCRFGGAEYLVSYGIRAIYEENDFAACQCTLGGGIVPPEQPPQIGINYNGLPTAYSEYDWNADGDYAGWNTAGWFNGLTNLRCFIHFEYDPPGMGGGGERMFGKGQWAGHSLGFN